MIDRKKCRSIKTELRILFVGSMTGIQLWKKHWSCVEGEFAVNRLETRNKHKG